MPSTTTPRQRAATLAERQHGAISLDQLLSAGFTAKQVKGLVARHHLTATDARGVYRMAGSARTWQQDLWVAVLAAPPGAAVSHTSAAALFQLSSPPEPPHVTVPRNASGRFGGVVAHWHDLSPTDRCEISGFPAVIPARTIVDCATMLDRDGLNELVDSAIGRGLVTFERIRAAQRRAGRRLGAPRLALALAPYAAGARPGSPAAARVLRRLHEWGLPAPECEYRIRDGNGRHLGTVDFAWPPWRAGLEYDGDEFHGPRRWAADDERQDRIEALGWRIERADRNDLRPSATRLRAVLTRLLSRPA